jgi:hypothetical protein
LHPIAASVGGDEALASELPNSVGRDRERQEVLPLLRRLGIPIDSAGGRVDEARNAGAARVLQQKKRTGGVRSDAGNRSFDRFRDADLRSQMKHDFAIFDRVGEGALVEYGALDQTDRGGQVLSFAGGEVVEDGNLNAALE